MKTLLTTFSMAAAMSLAVAAPMAAAQQNSGQTNAARNAQVNNQRILNEQAQPGAALHISPAVVRQIKQALNEAGYNLGHVNAQWGKQAQKGMRNYQQAQGLAPTGHINLATLRTLGVNVLRMQQSGPAGQATNQRIMQGGASGGNSQGGIGGGSGGPPE